MWCWSAKRWRISLFVKPVLKKNITKFSTSFIMAHWIMVCLCRFSVIQVVVVSHSKFFFRPLKNPFGFKGSCPLKLPTKVWLFSLWLYTRKGTSFFIFFSLSHCGPNTLSHSHPLCSHKLFIVKQENQLMLAFHQQNLNTPAERKLETSNHRDPVRSYWEHTGTFKSILLSGLLLNAEMNCQAAAVAAHFTYKHESSHLTAHQSPNKQPQIIIGQVSGNR